jgi:hypothetical protein
MMFTQDLPLDVRNCSEFAEVRHYNVMMNLYEAIGVSEQFRKPGEVLEIPDSFLHR